MTPRQKSLYWRKWSQVRSLLITLGGYAPAEADAERHAIHLEALGEDKSSSAFNNRDLDAVLDHFEDRLVLLSGPRDHLREHDQPLIRLRWAIERIGLPDSYLDAISRDEFKVDSWRSLDLPGLIRLRFTANARARARRKHAAA